MSTPAERLADWRQFRQSLTTISEQQQLAAVAAYWAKAPLILSNAYDLDQCSNWPTIWGMIHANRWCRNTVAIGMEATLRLAGMLPNRMILKLIPDCQTSDLLVLVIDGTWLLNYDWGFIRTYIEEHQTIHMWQFAGKEYKLTD